MGLAIVINYWIYVTTFSLNKMNDKPTRLGSILELHLTSNPSLVRHCSIAPGFSDHDGMIVTDTDIQVYSLYSTSRPHVKFHCTKVRTGT